MTLDEKRRRRRLERLIADINADQAAIDRVAAALQPPTDDETPAEPEQLDDTEPRSTQ
jgi:hypothetical protein